jgi:hypothetical protein
MKPIHPENTAATDRGSADWLEVVSRKVAGLRFGSVQITVHDGKVTQVESVEKTRFVPPKDPAAGGK